MGHSPKAVWLALAVVLVASPPRASTQTEAPDLEKAGPRVLLERLEQHLRSVDAGKCSTEAELEQGAASARWLLQRFNQTGWNKVPPDYTASLRMLARSLEQDEAATTDAANICSAASFASRDLQAKHRDCAKFGHARNNVKLEVRTVNEGVPQSNWEVYLIWLPEGDRFTGVPRRLEHLSTPARGSVPFPGEFEVYAHHPKSKHSTAQHRISVAGADPFTWTIHVPVVREPSLKK